MTNDIARFDQFVSSAPARIEAAQTTDEVQQVLTEAKVLAAAARAAKNREYEEMAKTVEQKALNRLGRMMAAQRDAGMMNKGGGDQKSNHRGNNNPSDQATLSNAGIDKNLAKAARKAYPEGWPSKPKSSGGPKLQEAKNKIFAYEANEGKLPPADRHFQMDGVTPSTYDRAIREVRGARAIFSQEYLDAIMRIANLETENAQLKKDLEALQTGQIMQMSRAALEQRKALVAKLKAKREAKAEIETIPDQKTVDDYERQIQRLKTQLNNERAKALSLATQRDAFKAFSNDDRRLLLVLVHPDRTTDPAEKAKRERAFKLINAIPELVET